MCLVEPLTFGSSFCFIDFHIFLILCTYLLHTDNNFAEGIYAAFVAESIDDIATIVELYSDGALTSEVFDKFLAGVGLGAKKRVKEDLLRALEKKKDESTEVAKAMVADDKIVYDKKQLFDMKPAEKKSSEVTIDTSNAAAVGGGSGIICPHYLKGTCKYGNGCQNLHSAAIDMSNAAAVGGGSGSGSGSGKKNIICPHYLKGTCKYGNGCRNMHPNDRDSIAPPSPVQSRPVTPPSPFRPVTPPPTAGGGPASSATSTPPPRAAIAPFLSEAQTLSAYCRLLPNSRMDAAQGYARFKKEHPRWNIYDCKLKALCQDHPMFLTWVPDNDTYGKGWIYAAGSGPADNGNFSQSLLDDPQDDLPEVSAVHMKGAAGGGPASSATGAPSRPATAPFLQLAQAMSAYCRLLPNSRMDAAQGHERFKKEHPRWSAYDYKPKALCLDHPMLLTWVRDDKAPGKGWIYVAGSGPQTTAKRGKSY